MEEFPVDFNSDGLHKKLVKEERKHVKEGDEILPNVREKIVKIANESIAQRRNSFEIPYDIVKPLAGYPEQQKKLVLELVERFRKVEQRWSQWNYQTGGYKGKSKTFTKDTKNVHFSDFYGLWISL